VGKDQEEVEAFLVKFNRASVTNKGLMLKELKQQAKTSAPILTKEERKALRKVYRKELVKRSAFLKIVAAWVITVPMSGLMAAILFFTIRGMLLP
jgi:PiT family inorganic phosphate transporter